MPPNATSNHGSGPSGRRRFLLAFLALALPVLGLAADTRTILFFGDSLTAGYGLDPDEPAYPALIQQRIEEAGLNWRVVNAGLSGDTTAAGLRRLDWVLRQRVDILVLELGGNDGLRGIPPDLSRANLQSMIDRARARYPDCTVVLAGMLLPPNMGEEYRGAFARIYPELAERNRTPFIPFLLEGVGGIPELNLADGIHPNADGHRIVADNVWKVLSTLL
ncbi:MAG TPA: arylesterase [Opitutaceae bacterium]|nr:arylesterase [Opitutaceae bacterium]